MLNNTCLVYNGYICFPSDTEKSYDFTTQAEWVEQKNLVKELTDEETFWQGTHALQYMTLCSILPEKEYEKLLKECLKGENSMTCFLWRNESETHDWIMKTYF